MLLFWASSWDLFPQPSPASTVPLRVRPPTHASLTEFFLMQPVYSEEDLVVTPTERERFTVRDHIAYTMVSAARYIFDIGTGYGPNMTEAKWLNRCCD